MITPKPREEACEILHVIEKYFPKIFAARDSIKWLHKHTGQGNQMEWAAIFFEEYCRPLLTNFLGGWYGARIIKSSRIDYQRHYNWDLKVHSVRDHKGRTNHDVILNDKDAIDRIVEYESGIGFIVARVSFTFDTDGSLSQWRNEYEHRTKKSANLRMMKEEGEVIDLAAIFIKDKPMLEKGMHDGWISIFRQGRQPDGSARKSKYMINLDKIPEDILITGCDEES